MTDNQPHLERRRASLPPAGRRARARRRVLRRHLHAVQRDDRPPAALVVECVAVDDVVAALAFAREHEPADRRPRRRALRRRPVALRRRRRARHARHGRHRRRRRPARRAGRRRRRLGRRRPRDPGPRPGHDGRARVDDRRRRPDARRRLRAGSSASTASPATTSLAAELVTWDGRIVRASERREPRAALGAARRRRKLRRRDGARARAPPARARGLRRRGAVRRRPRREVVRALPRRHERRARRALAGLRVHHRARRRRRPEQPAGPAGGRDPRHVGRRRRRRRAGAGPDPGARPRRRLLRRRPATPTSSARVDDPPGYRNYWTAENVVDLPDEAIDALVAARGRAARRPVAALHRGLGRRGPPVRPRRTRRSPAARPASSCTRCCSGTTRPTTSAAASWRARSGATCSRGRPARPTRTSSATKAARG